MSSAKLVRNEPGGGASRLLSFERALRGHRRPGQYVAAATDSFEPSYFAVASSPGEPLQLLIKPEGETATALAALTPGATADLSDALGPGFPMRRVDGLELVVLCTGTGIAACRPVIRSELARGLSRPVHLVYGVRHFAHRYFAGELAAWEVGGIDVHFAISAPEPERQGGARLYVQHIAEARGLIRDDVGVVLAGQPAMIDDVRERYLAAGASPARLLVNF